MCRRIVIADRDEVDRDIEVNHQWWRFSARYNVRRTQTVPAARMHAGESEGVMLRWGIPTQRKKEEGVVIRGASLVRRDEISTSDRRQAWLEGQRCIVPLAGFYVWHLTQERIRQPYYVRLVNRAVFGVAAVWERTVADDDDDDVIDACALITVEPNALLQEIDSSVGGQMPAILEREDYRLWLTCAASEAQALLRPYPRERMVAHPVPPYVNYPEYDGPPLIHAIRS
jgi:putative SOS response-associated peptidase YedK